MKAECAGVSYAVVPYCRPLGRTSAASNGATDNARACAARMVALGQAAECSRGIGTRGGAAVRQTVAPHRVGAGPHHRVRMAANEAISRLAHGAWMPRYVLMHGDLWKGNVLLRSRRASARLASRRSAFRGHRLGGAPNLMATASMTCFALPSLSGSAITSLRLEIGRYCRLLQCDRIDAKSHLLVSARSHRHVPEGSPAASLCASGEDLIRRDRTSRAGRAASVHLSAITRRFARGRMQCAPVRSTCASPRR